MGFDEPNRIKSTPVKYHLLPCATDLCLCFATSAYDLITTRIARDREISRVNGVPIRSSACAGC
jgi:hypothetical protein